MNRAVRLLPGVAVLLALSAVAACSRKPSPPPNIVILLIDALRADRLDLQIAGQPLAPFLQGLKRQSVSFERAYTVAPWTMASLATMWTSRYPTQHRVDAFRSVLAAGEDTLAERLRQRGYRTGGFTANILLHSGAGFAQGFDTYVLDAVLGEQLQQHPKTHAAELDGKLLAWMDQQRGIDKPLFVYAHYLDVHEPLLPRREDIEAVIAARAQGDEKRSALQTIGWDLRQMPKRSDGIWGILTDDLYDAELIGLDTELKRLFDELRRRGVLDNAVVILTADHGEAFAEHTIRGHGTVLFEEVLRIPLLVMRTGNGGGRVHTPVSLLDLMPTLLELAGEKARDRIEGRSLVPFLNHNEQIVRGVEALGDWFSGRRRRGELYAESGRDPKDSIAPVQHRRALVDHNLKVIETLDGKYMAYDLARDPHEQHPLATDSSQAQQLISRLHSWSQQIATTATPEQQRRLSEDVKEQMRALGYETH